MCESRWHLYLKQGSRSLKSPDKSGIPMEIECWGLFLRLFSSLIFAKLLSMWCAHENFLLWHRWTKREDVFYKQGFSSGRLSTGYIGLILIRSYHLIPEQRDERWGLSAQWKDRRQWVQIEIYEIPLKCKGRKGFLLGQTLGEAGQRGHGDSILETVKTWSRVTSVGL